MHTYAAVCHAANHKDDGFVGGHERLDVDHVLRVERGAHLGTAGGQVLRYGILDHLLNSNA